MGGESEPSNELIGLRIWRLIAERGLSNAAVGAKMGVSRQAVWHWTKGRNLPRERYRLAEALGVGLESLYGRSGDAKSEEDWLRALRDRLEPEEAAELLRLLAASDPAALLKALRKSAR